MKINFTSSLRQIINLQKPIIEQDSMGGGNTKWQDLASVRSDVKALYDNSSAENFNSMQIMSNPFYRFRIRFRKDLDSNMRIIYNNRIFQIKHIVNQNELNFIQVIIAQENL